MTTPEERTQENLSDILDRLRELEKEHAVIGVELANLKKELTGFESGVSRGLWIIGGGFIMALVSWVVNGGLNDKIQ